MSQTIKNASKLSPAFVFVVICIQICSCHLSYEQLGRSVELIGTIDSAKERATSCRSLVNYANNVGNLSSQERQALQLLIPNLVENCYTFLEHVTNLRWNQLGLDNSSGIGGKLARIKSESDPISTPESSLFRENSRLLPEIPVSAYPRVNDNDDVKKSFYDWHLTEFRKLVSKEAFAKGADYCPFITTGVFGDIINFVQNYLFADKNNLNQFIPSKSPLASFKSLSRSKPDSRLQNLLFVGRKCKQFKAESHLESRPAKHLTIANDQRVDPTNYLSPEHALSILSPNPTCEKEGIFLLIRLHGIKDDQVLTQLSESSTNLFAACLENLAQVKTKLKVLQKPLTYEQKAFSKELIDFLGNEFVTERNSNIIDRLNPRSLINNNIEYDLFFQDRVQTKLNKNGINLMRAYENGEPICDTIKTYDFYNVVNEDLTNSMELLHILMSINDLEVDLAQFRDNQQLQSTLLWYLCKDLTLYQLNVKDLNASFKFTV